MAPRAHKTDRGSAFFGPQDWLVNLVGGDRRGHSLDPQLARAIIHTEAVADWDWHEVVSPDGVRCFVSPRRAA
jgi:hypothetical protein